MKRHKETWGDMSRHEEALKTRDINRNGQNTLEMVF